MDTVTPRDYFDTGLDLLAEGGPSAVTVAALCKGLGVTKGSFYHHFTGIPDFLLRLLDYWEKQVRQVALEAFRSAHDAKLTEVAKLVATWGIHHEAETAIRALARTDSCAAEVQRRVDESREQGLVRLLVGIGVEQARAGVLARLGLAILIGTQQREHPVDRRQLERTFDEYQHWVEQAAGGGAVTGRRGWRR